VNRKALCTLTWLALSAAPVHAARAQRGVVPPPPAAGDSALEARTTAVASQLRCPVCQGLSIQESPSELAQQMRSVVRDQLSAGKSPAEVRAYFVSKYGEWILLEPRPVGFNVLVYALPAVVVVGGLVLIVVVVRRWTRQPEAPA
jgi:cytochrome c-type biogenesis protein CcmH